MINCIVVDDEPIARNGLIEYIEQVDFLFAVEACKNAIEASSVLGQKSIDLVFLDIQMPKLTGVDFLRTLSNPPLVILTTAFPEYALEGFELNVLDYLLKPISFERFFKAVNKARTQLTLTKKNQSSISEPYFFVKSNQKLEKVIIEDILFVEALANYVINYTREKKHIVYMSFKGIESQLPSNLFLKIHKSYMVALNAIQTIDNDEVIINGHILPVSKSFRPAVMERVAKHLFKRN